MLPFASSCLIKGFSSIKQPLHYANGDFLRQLNSPFSVDQIGLEPMTSRL